MARALKFIRALSVRWLWVYVAAWMSFTLSLAFWCGSVAVPPTKALFYYATAANWTSVLLFVAGVCLILGCLLSIVKSQKLLTGIGLFIPSSLCMLLAAAMIGPAPYTLAHLDDKDFDGHRYNLERYGLSDFGPPYGNTFATSMVYVLYECDPSNIFCQVIYNEKFTLQDDMHHNKNPALIADIKHIAVSIDGAIVYSYPPA